MSSSQPRTDSAGQTVERRPRQTADGGDVEPRRETPPERPRERPGYDEGPERPEAEVERLFERDESDVVDLGDEVGEPVDIGPDERGEPDPRQGD